MTRPQRIQLSRKRGAKLPPGTVNAARPGRWGNPFNWQDCDPTLLDAKNKQLAQMDYRHWLEGRFGDYEQERRAWILSHLCLIREAEYVACWCKVTDSCHVDIIIELAMAEVEMSQETR